MPSRNGQQRRAKSSPKLRNILTSVRHQIVAGNYRPGERLPSRAHWESQFRVSWATVQKAFNVLSREGFVRTAGRSGTFVADRPPHLNRFGLLFRHKSSDGTRWARFCDQLLLEVEALHQHSAYQVTTYQGIDGHTDVEDFRRLTADIECGRLAGLIFTSPPGDEFSGTDILDDLRIARIQVEGARSEAGMALLQIDWPAFFDMAAKHFVARGRKRIALVSYRGFYDDHQLDFHKALKRHGLETRDYWIQEPDWTYPEGIRRCVQLLVSGPIAERPDGLIVNDDNQIDSAAEGIRAANVAVPRDLDVVAFSDLPYLVPACVPIRHFGFRVSTLLELCVETLAAKVRGQSPPQHPIVVPIEAAGTTEPAVNVGARLAHDQRDFSSSVSCSLSNLGHRSEQSSFQKGAVS